MSVDAKAIKAFALLRVLTGGWLVWMALPNLDPDFLAGFPSMVGTWSANQPDGFVHWTLAQLVAPYARSIAMGLPVAWVLAAAAVTIGFLLRPIALLIGVFGLMLMVAAMPANPALGQTAFLLVMLLATLILGDAGRIYGIDQFLFRDAENPDKPVKGKFKNAKQRAAVEKLNKSLKKVDKNAKSKKAPVEA